MRRVLLSVCLIVLAASFASSQVPNLSDTTSTPIPGAGHNYFRMLTETVDPSNGSVSLRIQLPVPKGRGVTVPLVLAYGSNGAHFIINKAPGSLTWGESASITGYNGEWVYNYGGWSYGVPTLSVGSKTVNLNDGMNTVCEVAINYMYSDPAGARYPLNLSITGFTPGHHSTNSCSNNFSQFPTGGSGPVLASTTALGNDAGFYLEPVMVADADGGVVSFPGQIYTGTLAASSVEDRNGNVVSITGASGAISYSDTLGRAAVSISALNSSEDQIAISGLNPYQIHWNNSVPFAFGVTMTKESSDGCSTGGANGNDRDISSITLPNGQSYTFSYDTDPTQYGLLNRITYPTGGYVQYTWGVNTQSEYGEWDDQYNGLCAYIYDDIVLKERVVSFDGTTPALDQTFAYTTNWTNKAQGTWSTKTTTVKTTDLLKGGSFQTVYTYTQQTIAPQPNTDIAITNSVPGESQIQYYDWNGTLLRTVAKGWYDQYQMECDLESPGGGLVAGSFYKYAQGDQVTDKRDYDYGQITSLTACSSGAPIPSVTPRREVTTQPASFAATRIFPAEASIFDRPSQIVTYGNGTKAAETDYTYDQTGVSGTSGVTGHDYTNYGDSYNIRGNADTKTEWLNVGGTSPVTTYKYDDTGQLTSMVDPCGNTTCSDMSGSNYTTSYSYADNFASGTPPGPTNAYLTQITYPNTGVAHQENFAYNYADGQLAWSKDQNSQQTSYFYNDSLDRLTGINYPDCVAARVCTSSTHSAAYSYNDTAPSPSVTTTKLANSDPTVLSESIMDGVGHVVRTELTSDPEGTDYTDTTYDGEGLVWTQSNPYRSTSDPSYGVTTDSYDALGRVFSVVYADSNTEATSYSANCATVTDPATKARETCTDGLGRLATVYEDPNGLNYTTTYGYDALNNLTSVAQGASQTRTFVYDSLSRKTSSTNPEESFGTSYAYDANGNMSTRVAPLENQTGSSTVTTTYTYDALNRLTSKSYSDSTPAATFYYDLDWAGIDGWKINSLNNTIGRLMATCTGPAPQNCSTATIDNYDAMGRITEFWQCSPYNCSSGSWSTTYAYDLAGGLTSWTHPAGFTIKNSYDGAQRIAQITCIASCQANSPATLAFGPGANNSIIYTAWGAIQTLDNGTVNGCAPQTNCPQETYAYNDRMQPAMIELGTGSDLSADYCLVYNYYTNQGTPAGCGSPAQGAGDNGNVSGYLYQDKVNASLSHSVENTYDSLNRLYTSCAFAGSQCPGPGSALYYFTFVDGPYGNMSCSPNPGQCATDLQYDTHNHITNSGYSYDAAGNLANDGVHSYQYDAEGRLVTVDQGAFSSSTFDALGQVMERIIPGVRSERLWDPLTGLELGRYDGIHNSWWERNVRLGSRTLGYYYTNNATHLLHYNALGSTTLVTDENGAVGMDLLFYPFGQQWTTTGGWVDQHFASLPDLEVDLDLYPASKRYMAPRLGRWMTPDPDNAGADPGNPQSWNGYSYALNNPTTLTDPSGLKYKVCQTDENGNQTNCTTISDEQFEQFEQENSNSLSFTGSGVIAANGTDIGTYKQTSVDLPALASDVIAGVNANRPADFIVAAAGASVFVGTGVGAVLYPTGTGIGLTTLTISAATAGPLVTDPDVQRLVDWLFQESDRLPGGTAGAVRYELMNNDTVGGVSHVQKAQDAIKWATDMLKSGKLSLNDQIRVRAMIKELVDALATKGVR